MQNNPDKIKGVFSSQEIRKVGTGTTTRKTVAKTFWFADEEEDGRLSILPINSNYIPTGKKKFISRDELIERFSPEPEFYIQSVYPKMRELNETIDRADTSRDKGETFSAEYEYENALAVDVENVRANFGIGLTYLSRGETDKAENIFSRLVNLEAAFAEEHKHLFNDFGINLRKNKMLEQALEYYEKAKELTKDDDNLFVNIARVYLELKDIPKCLEHLVMALKISPTNEIALKFLTWLEAKKMISPVQFKDAQEAVKPQTPPAAAEDLTDTLPLEPDTPSPARAAAASEKPKVDLLSGHTKVPADGPIQAPAPEKPKLDLLSGHATVPADGPIQAPDEPVHDPLSGNGPL